MASLPVQIIRHLNHRSFYIRILNKNSTNHTQAYAQHALIESATYPDVLSPFTGHHGDGIRSCLTSMRSTQTAHLPSTWIVSLPPISRISGCALRPLIVLGRYSRCRMKDVWKLLSIRALVSTALVLSKSIDTSVCVSLSSPTSRPETLRPHNQSCKALNISPIARLSWSSLALKNHLYCEYLPTYTSCTGDSSLR